MGALPDKSSSGTALFGNRQMTTRQKLQPYRYCHHDRYQWQQCHLDHPRRIAAWYSRTNPASRRHQSGSLLEFIQRRNRIGINTTNPGARLDVDGNVLISSVAGPASELRFQEPPGNGNFYTSFKATRQTVNIDYILPPHSLATEGILATDPAGNLTWRNVLPPAVTVPFNQITSGVNTGQTSSLATVRPCAIRAPVSSMLIPSAEHEQR